MACPMCTGTDYAADCSAGRCYWDEREQYEEDERVRAREEEERYFADESSRQDDIARDVRNGAWGVLPSLGLVEPDEEAIPW